MNRLNESEVYSITRMRFSIVYISRLFPATTYSAITRWQYTMWFPGDSILGGVPVTAYYVVSRRQHSQWFPATAYSVVSRQQHIRWFLGDNIFGGVPATACSVVSRRQHARRVVSRLHITMWCPGGLHTPWFPGDNTRGGTCIDTPTVVGKQNGALYYVTKRKRHVTSST